MQKQVKILDIKIDVISKQEALDKIKNLLKSDELRKSSNSAGRQLVTTNPEFILAAQKDNEFKNIINNSWLSVADGYGIMLAAKYLNEIGNSKNQIGNFLTGIKIAYWGFVRSKKLDVITDVITGTDLVPEICKQSTINNQQFKIFLLGGYDDTPKLAAERLKKQFNNLTIYHSIFEAPDIINKINSAKPNILFVALNHPRAQKWINKNLEKMPSVKLAIGVGGAFDYISGKIKRAPKFWRSCGLEWLYRLFTQPKRLGRIWRATVIFPWTVFINTITRK